MNIVFGVKKNREAILGGRAAAPLGVGPPVREDRGRSPLVVIIILSYDSSKFLILNITRNFASTQKLTYSFVYLLETISSSNKSRVKIQYFFREIDEVPPTHIVQIK